MLDLAVAASLFWYGMTYINTHFLSVSDQVSWLVHLSRLSYIFIATLVLSTVIKKCKLYQYTSVLYLLAFALTLIFYLKSWLGNDFFNYFSLFFTNILYCMMIFYSLKERYLL